MYRTAASFFHPKSVSAVLPFGKTLVPLRTDLIDREIEEIVKKYNAKAIMRDAAVRGGDSADAPDVIRKMHGDGGERLNRNCQQSGEDLGQLLDRVETLEEIDSDLIQADAASEATKAMRTRLPDACAAKSVEIRRRHERRRFEERLGIDRDVHRPNIPFTVFVILLVFSAEIFLGTAFYLNVENDMIGAATIAILVSLALVLTTLTTSLVGLRYAINGAPGSWGRRSAVVFSVIGLALVFYLALVVAHDRDQLATFDPNQAFVRRFDWSILFHPSEWFHFEMPLYGLSFLLLMLGLAALSLWKGYTGIFDPIPGYGPRHAAWRNAANTAEDLVRGLRDATYAPIERAQASVDRVLGENREALERARPLIQAADNREQQYRASAEVVLTIINTAIRIAQDAYLAVRPERPGYFDQYLSAEHIPALTVSAAKVHDRVAELSQAVVDNRQRGREAKLALTAMFNERERELEATLASLEQLGADKLRHDSRTGFEPVGGVA